MVDKLCILLTIVFKGCLYLTAILIDIDSNNSVIKDQGFLEQHICMKHTNRVSFLIVFTVARCLGLEMRGDL